MSPKAQCALVGTKKFCAYGGTKTGFCAYGGTKISLWILVSNKYLTGLDCNVPCMDGARDIFFFPTNLRRKEIFAFEEKQLLFISREGWCTAHADGILFRSLFHFYSCDSISPMCS